MATKYVTYCTKTKLDCGFVPSSQVILCVQDSALIVQPEPLCGLDLTTLIATICSAGVLETGCQNFLYQYRFSYNDEQITNPSTRPLIESDITGVICEGCLTDWIMQQISCVAGDNCVEDSTSINFSLTEEGCITGAAIISPDADNQLSIHANGLYAAGSTPCVADSASIDFSLDEGGCVTGDVLISADADNQLSLHADGLYAAGGGGGDGWALLGNAGTVDGTNFWGTTDNVALTARVNNLAALRFDSGFDSASINITGNPNSGNLITDSYNSFIGEGDTNSITTSEEVFIGGGLDNVLIEGFGDTIGGGNTNTIDGGSSGAASNTIAGGAFNTIDNAVFGQVIGFNAIGGGDTNLIQDGDDCDIAGGIQNSIIQGTACNIAGGHFNSISGTGLGTTLENIAEGCFIGGGGHHTFIAAANSIESSVIGNGAPRWSSIVGGSNNHLTEACQYASILGGLNNNIYFTYYSAILAGQANTITSLLSNAEYSIIVGGHLNEISNADRCTVINGDHHLLDTVTNSTILGGSFLKLGNYSVGFNHGDLGVTTVDASAFAGIGLWCDIDTWVANTDGTARKLKLIEPNTDFNFSSANYTSFQAQAQGANVEYVMPAATGSPTDVLTIDTVVGVVTTLKWDTGGGGGGFITALSDTNSVDLNVIGTTLSADSKISATVGNQVVINADGLYVPTGVITTKTTTYNATTADVTIFCDATTGSMTINLPATASSLTHIFNIKKIDSSGNTVTIDGNASETIDGATTKVISTQYQSYTIQADNTGWYIL